MKKNIIILTVFVSTSVLIDAEEGRATSLSSEAYNSANSAASSAYKDTKSAASSAGKAATAAGKALTPSQSTLSEGMAVMGALADAQSGVMVPPPNQ